MTLISNRDIIWYSIKGDTMGFNNGFKKTTFGIYTLLTNFDKENICFYQKAIEEYKKVKHDKYHLHILQASNQYCDYGLWYSKESKTHDLADFWNIYDSIKKDCHFLKEILINGVIYVPKGKK